MLGDQARRAVERAAIVGQRLDCELVRSLLPLDEPDFLAHVKELISASLLVEVLAEQLALRHVVVVGQVRPENQVEPGETAGSVCPRS
jgi:hypothetical protein